jgi:2-methylcitrate dehydratase PrpD
MKTLGRVAFTVAWAALAWLTTVQSGAAAPDSDFPSKPIRLIVTFRLYACCNPVHPALDALKDVLGQLKPAPADIERIDIATYRFASVMRNPDPPNYFASKYSLPHAAATMVIRGGAGHTMLDDSALEDPAIRALRHRVTISEDAAMSAVAPPLEAGARNGGPQGRPQRHPGGQQPSRRLP